MKIRILQQDLYPSLQSVSRSIGSKPTLPVLANILLQTEEGKLKLAATNLEIGVIKKINANIEEEGEVTVPAKTLLDIISSLSDELTLESVGEQLKIASKSFNASINGISANEFPTIPLSSENNILIDSKIISSSVSQISFAAASDEGRPVLTGILTQIGKDSLEMVATDGFRLAHKTGQIEMESSDQFKALIPKKTFEEVTRIISEELKTSDQDKISISTTENQNQIIFKIGNTEVSSRLIEGQFPSWEKIVPQKFENRTIVEKQDLLKAVKLASIFARDSANIVKLDVDNNLIKINSEAKELGAGESDLEAQTEGTHINIAFNSRYLIDALNSCPTTQISIEFSGNLSPALLKPIGETGLEYVVMPIRLS